MKILFVAMSDSIHTARWINQVSGLHKTYLFPSIECGKTHPELKNTVVYHAIYSKKPPLKNKVRVNGFPVFSDNLATGLCYLVNSKYQNYRVKKLVRLIKKIKPDVIHSLEIQHGGYIVSEAKKIYKGKFPYWIATNWGSDIQLFGRLSGHQEKIKEVLGNADYYSCECQRDICLAKNFGFKGKTLPVLPNAGGYDLKAVGPFRRTLPSKRKIIMLKGYYGWSGRSLVGLTALSRLKNLLKGYELYIHSPISDGMAISPTTPSAIEVAAELFSKNTGVKVTILPVGTPHQKLLKTYGKARIAIGLSIGDGISTSFLEAMLMGAYPIQSNTSCADEWVTSGKSGILVPPEEPETIAEAIQKALTSDKLVDEAAKINWQTAKKRLEKDFLKRKTIKFYEEIKKFDAGL